jgi:hypothetical protein
MAMRNVAVHLTTFMKCILVLPMIRISLSNLRRKGDAKSSRIDFPQPTHNSLPLFLKFMGHTALALCTVVSLMTSQAIAKIKPLNSRATAVHDSTGGLPLTVLFENPQLLILLYQKI